LTESGFRKLWIAGIFVVAAAIVISSLVPRPLVPNQTGGDKVLHFVAYFVLALLASGIVTRERLPLAMLRCFLLGLALEAAQALLTAHRMAEWTDLVANGSGVLLAWLAAAGGRAGWAPRAAARMLRRRES
jgi:VanZ family protein